MEGGGGGGDEGMTEQLVCRRTKQFVTFETLLEKVSQTIGQVIWDVTGGDI